MTTEMKNQGVKCEYDTKETEQTYSKIDDSKEGKNQNQNNC